MCSGHIPYIYNFPSWFVESCKFQNWIPCPLLVHTRRAVTGLRWVSKGSVSAQPGSGITHRDTYWGAEQSGQSWVWKEHSLHPGSSSAFPGRTTSQSPHCQEHRERTSKHCSWAAKQPPDILNKWINEFTESACIFLGTKCPTSP